MVLDGHLFVLIGLIHLKKMNCILSQDINDLIETLFQFGLNGLIDTFHKFDLGFWLKFNLCKMEHYPKIDPCTIGYMKLIYSQLNVIYLYTGNEKADHFSKQVEKYITIINIFKMYKIKYSSLKALNRV